MVDNPSLQKHKKTSVHYMDRQDTQVIHLFTHMHLYNTYIIYMVS